MPTDPPSRGSSPAHAPVASPVHDPLPLALGQSLAHFQAIIESSDDAIVAKTLEGIVLSWNPAAERIFGYSAAEMIGQPITRLFPPERLDEEDEIMARLRQGGRIEHFLTVRVHRNGQPVHVSASISPIRDAAGTIIGASKIARDVSDRVHAERTIWRQMHFDSLTGLSNRRLFMERLRNIVGRRVEGGNEAGLIFIDLDHFREINDQLGHAHGDALLIQAADNIRRCVREGDVLARLAADEFVVLLPGLGQGPALDAIARQIAAALRQPFLLAGQDIAMTASLGIVTLSPRVDSADELMLHGDLAVQEAKRLGRGRIEPFTPRLRQAAQRRQRLLNDLRHALALGQFHLHFQPILHLASGQLRRCEVLLRWQHPEFGAVPPLEFIPLAEESGAIREIGDWVFRQALDQVADWRDRLGCTLQVAVNLSPAQLRGTGDDLEQWAGELARRGLPPGSMACEITESMVLDPTEEILRKLAMLRDAGIEISMDDFGTGYSSYATLIRLPLRTLKIDRSFVTEIEGSARALAVCKGMVVMAHELGLSVVAEGIETAGQLALMQRIGCDAVQGFGICRPGPVTAVEHYFAADGAAPSGAIDAATMAPTTPQSSSSGAMPGNSTEV